MDYLKFYDLDEDPFRFTPDPDFFYRSEGHNEVLLSLDYLIDRREGFLLITGEPGTGKTITLKVFIEKCKDEYEIALIITPRLSPEEFLLAVLDDLNVPQPTGGKNEIIKAFREFLLTSAVLGKRTVIMVDEAQQLPDETLEELRLLSNLETEKEKLLQIILIGQTELKARLRQNHLRQLDQRITVRAELHSFTQQETSEYISFRLNRAGKGMTVFDEQAKQTIYALTGGIPRTINLLASRALMSAFIEESRTVGERHVRQAASHVFYSPSGSDPLSIFNPIRRFFGGSVETKPVIVDKNLSTPRPTRPAGRLRSATVAVIIVGSIAVGGIYLFTQKTGPVAKQVAPVQQNLSTAAVASPPVQAVKAVVAKPAETVPPASALTDPRLGDSAVISAMDNKKKEAVVLSAPLRDLPEFIPRAALDPAYGKKNPGWELYRGKVTEFRVMREKSGVIKGIQVLDRGGAGVLETFMQRALQQVSGTSTFKAESTEQKEGYKIERGTVGNKIQAVCYRDKNGGRLRAFVLTWL